MNDPTTVSLIGQQWASRRVVVFHGQRDTRISTGEDYETRTLGEIFAMPPGSDDKGNSLACIPSTYHDYDARNHAAQRERGVFVMLTADIDSGDHPLDRIEPLVRDFVGAHAFLIYSSAHARPGDMRWRVLIPIETPCDFETWHDAQNALFNHLEHNSIEVDRAMDRAGQPVFLPNVPKVHAKTGEDLRDEWNCAVHYKRSTTGVGAPALPLDAGKVAQGIDAIKRKREEDEKERARIRKEIEARRAAKPPSDGSSVMADFNAGNSIANLLELYGYQQSPRNSDDWRSPHQTGESYATRIIGDKWVSLSMSDTAAQLGDTCATGCYGDAYDLFVHYEHGNDHKAAFRALYAERRASSPQPSPPPRSADDPGWSEPPEGPEDPTEVAEISAQDVDTEAADTPRLPFFWFDEAQANLEANDFVEGLLTTTAMSVIYGPSNCGKTFFIVDLALHVAMGQEWRGRAVDKGAVVYLSLEGSMGIRNRLAAFRKHHGIDDRLPFIAMPQPVNLLDSEADVRAVIELVEHIADESGLAVSLVIIDTLSRAMAGGNENSPEDMTALIGNCDRIRDATQAHVCIVHHSGKDDARGARGHSSLRAATDTEIEIKRDPELTFSTVRIAKQRDLEAGDPFAFTLQSVALGTNRRGKDVTSCVVVETEQTVVLSRSGAALSPKEEQAMRALTDCILASGFEVENDRNGGQIQAVTLHTWKRAMQAAEIIDRNNDDVSRVQYNRIKKALVSKGKARTDGTVIWEA